MGVIITSEAGVFRTVFFSSRGKVFLLGRHMMGGFELIDIVGFASHDSMVCQGKACVRL